MKRSGAGRYGAEGVAVTGWTGGVRLAEQARRYAPGGVLAVLLLGWCGAAWGQEGVEDREAALFGGGEEEEPAEEEAAEPPGEAEREGALFGASPLMEEAAVVERLAASYDTLDLGGRLFLRLDGMGRDGQGWREATLSSQNLLDLYLDARPSERVRAYVNGRLIFDPTVNEQVEGLGALGGGGGLGALGGAPSKARGQLDQLWLKFDVGQVAYVTVGKQRVKWGAGRFWQPTDFLNQQRLDPLAVFDQRLGVDLVRVHVPFEGTNINTYAIAFVDDAQTPGDVGVAGRAEVVLGEAEVTASAAWRAGAPLRLGTSASFGLGWLDLRGEAAAIRGDRGPYWEGEFAPERLVVPTERSRREEWILQAVGGGEVSIPVGDDDAIIFGAEYFYNQAGYEDASLYPWLLFAGGFTPLYLGRHYAGVYGVVQGPGQLNDWTFVLSTLGNLSDGSLISRFDVNVQALTYLTVNVYAAAHYEEEGEFRFGLSLPATPGLLPEGLEVPPSALDLGMSVRVNL